MESSIAQKVEKFLTDTADARFLSEKCRDYFDNKQWTEAEVKKLNSRKQAPITVNRVKPKVKGLIGLYNLRQSDPKAFPRTQKHEKASHAVTDALRYVADNNEFDDLKLEVAEDFFVEGYGGAFVPVRQKKSGEVEILIQLIPWDRIYYDPHSRRKDFKDARWMGIVMWMYKDEAKEMFPDADIDELFNEEEYQDETFEDRPKWFDKQTDRVRIALHFEIVKSKWTMAIRSGNYDIVKQQDSPFLDDEGEPTNPIELVSANVDRNNNRYGEVAGFLDQQDEINHRRSKFLHYLNQRQTHGRRGAIKDIAAWKREAAKPDGHHEWEGEEWGKDVGIVDTTKQLQGQFELYQDAKGELDAVSFNAQLAGERQEGDLSGVAINRLQQAGTIEINHYYNLLSGWEKRIYRQVWARVKQHWNEEKWIRITDDQDSLRWVGLNSQVTARQFLEEKINDESLSLVDRKRFAASYTFLIQAEQSQDQGEAEAARQQLDAIVDVQNQVAELDVDIIIDQSFDVINIQEEQFRLLAQFAQGSDIDIVELIELSQIRNKDELIEKIEKRRQERLEAQGNLANAEAKEKEADIMVKATQADKNQAEADQKKIENELLINQPERVNSVAV